MAARMGGGAVTILRDSPGLRGVVGRAVVVGGGGRGRPEVAGAAGAAGAAAWTTRRGGGNEDDAGDGGDEKCGGLQLGDGHERGGLL